MKRYELTVVPSYCSNWDLNKALRELIQNGVDEEKKHPESKFTVRYNKDDEIVQFANKAGTLTIDTILFGNTDKEGDNDTLGEFGEGYKIAALVLNRLGKTLTIKNGLTGEIWETGFCKSETWGQKVLCFDVYKDDDLPKELCFEVEGISEEEYESMKKLWLGFADEDIEKVQTIFGEIILDDRFGGYVYVNGIKVLNHTAIKKWGYNFKPGVLPLERDRSVCSDYDLADKISRMLDYAANKDLLDPEVIVECIVDGSLETRYISSKKIKDALWGNFKENNKTEFSIPVAFHSDYDKIKNAGGKPVFVDYYMYELLKDRANKEYQNLLNATEYSGMTTKEKFEAWIEKWADQLDEEAVEEFETILEDL